MPKTSDNFRLILIFCGATVASIFLLISALALLPPRDDFDPSNPYWNGHLIFSKITNTSVFDIYRSDPKKVVLFVIGPSSDIPKRSIDIWKRFVEGGGTLVLMDETGIVNCVLEEFGLRIRVDGRPMLDTVFYYNSWKVPKIIDVRKSDLTTNISVIFMNVPSVLNISVYNSDLRVLAYSSSFSFLDSDGNGYPSDDERMGPFPVAVEVTYASGRVILLSDSSLFTNSIINLGDNMRLLKNIAGNRVVAIDSSVWRRSMHAEFREIIIFAYNFASIPEIKYSIVVVTLITVYVLASRRWSSPGGHDELQTLLIKHPNWDRRLLEKLREERG
ncbi:MAG: DUF4350 domain-containing protein [Candidatus Korarchaeum sp.]